MQRQLQRICLLIIEDNLDHREIIQMALNQCLPEAQVIWTEDGAHTLAYLNTCYADGQPFPQLILMDLYLPAAEDGWALLKELKVFSNHHRIPVVVLSNSNSPEDIREAYRLGANSFITKPLTHERWKEYFDMMRHYWWVINTFPPRKPSGAY